MTYINPCSEVEDSQQCCETKAGRSDPLTRVVENEVLSDVSVFRTFYPR